MKMLIKKLFIILIFAGLFYAQNGKALNFDGVDDYVTMGATALDFTGTTARSFAFWVYQRTDQTDTIIAKYQSTTGNGSYVFSINSGGIANLYLITTSYATGRINRRSASGAVPLNRWNHIVGTWTGGTTSSSMSIYINGVETSYGTSDDGGTFTGLVSNTNPTLFGARNDTAATDFVNFLDGLIDEVRVYNRALTAAEVRTLYYGHATRVGLVGYWPLIGVTSGTFEPDFSGKANHWTRTSGPYRSALSPFIRFRR